MQGPEGSCSGRQSEPGDFHTCLTGDAGGEPQISVLVDWRSRVLGWHTCQRTGSRQSGMHLDLGGVVMGYRAPGQHNNLLKSTLWKPCTHEPGAENCPGKGVWDMREGRLLREYTSVEK